MTTNEDSETPAGGPKWCVLEANERRVLGVLVEKAKTTPDNYPLSLNGLRSGCNQKSNRYPQMTLEEEHIDEAIESLRGRGAVSIIQGDGRVEKYRHLAYDWLGVDKVELAVMAELLLRGAQTIGELRGRAARMEPIKGMNELGPLLESLLDKSLIRYLSPPGRGAVVTHNLYQPQELEKLQRVHGSTTAPPPPEVTSHVEAAARPTPPPAAPATAPAPVAPPAPAGVSAEIENLERTVATLRSEFSAFKEETESTLASLREVLDDLNRQLGN